MLFAFYCLDRDGHADVRAQNREAHVAYLTSRRDAMVTAGPLLDDDGESMIGSLILLDLPDRAAAEAFAAGDPYAKAGLFKSVRIHPWRKVF